MNGLPLSQFIRCWEYSSMQALSTEPVVRKKRISAIYTVFFKRHPILFCVFVSGLASVMVAVRGQDGHFIAAALVLCFGIVWGIGAKAKALDTWLVDEVYDCGDCLWIRNEGRDWKIPFEQITTTNRAWDKSVFWGSLFLIETRDGTKVYFIMALSAFLNKDLWRRMRHGTWAR